MVARPRPRTEERQLKCGINSITRDRLSANLRCILLPVGMVSMLTKRVDGFCPPLVCLKKAWCLIEDDDEDEDEIDANNEGRR